jgi:hypothetical protein
MRFQKVFQHVFRATDGEFKVCRFLFSRVLEILVTVMQFDFEELGVDHFCEFDWVNCPNKVDVFMHELAKALLRHFQGLE